MHGYSSEELVQLTNLRAHQISELERAIKNYDVALRSNHIQSILTKRREVDAQFDTFNHNLNLMLIDKQRRMYNIERNRYQRYYY